MKKKSHQIILRIILNINYITFNTSVPTPQKTHFLYYRIQSVNRKTVCSLFGKKRMSRTSKLAVRVVTTALSMVRDEGIIPTGDRLANILL